MAEKKFWFRKTCLSMYIRFKSNLIKEKIETVI